MMAQASYARRALAQTQYQALDLKGRLDGAGPHQLVAILYEELQRALDIAYVAATKGHNVAGHPQITRARSILVALESSLDFKTGTGLSEALAGVYRAMRRELGEAARQANSDRLLALGDGVRSIAGAWKAISN